MFRVTWQLSVKKCHLKKNTYGRAALSFSDEQFGTSVRSLKRIQYCNFNLGSYRYFVPI